MRPAPSVFLSGTADAAALLAALRQAGYQTSRAARVTFTVLDTIDGRLHVNGLRLVATQSDTLTLTLSGPSSSPGSAVVSSLPIRASDLPAGPWRDSVAAAGGERLLLAQATVAATRTVASLCTPSGEVRSLVTLDDKMHLSGRRKPLASAVTVHRVAGKGKARRRAEALCVEAGLLAHSDVLGEVLDQADVDLTGVAGSPADLDVTTLAIDGFRSVLTDLFVAVEGYWRGAVDRCDPAFVRGLRVVTRRSRSVLVEGRNVLPREAQAMAGAGLGLLGTHTSAARDLDVFVEEWDGYLGLLPSESVAALAPLRGLLQARRAVAYAELAVGLSSPEVNHFVREWGKWLRKPVPARSLARSPDSTRPLGEVVGERIERAHLTLLENGRLITDESPAAQLHDLRRDAKRLRYLLECFSGVLPTKATKQFVRRLKALQDNLGAHQDAEMHALQLMMLLQQHAADDLAQETTAAATLLVQHLQQRTAAARREFSTRFEEYDSPTSQLALGRVLAVAPD